MKEILTLNESRQLIALEKTIEHAKKTFFMEGGGALAEIRDSKLYKLSAAKWNSRNAGGLKMDLLPLGFLRKIR
jgi:hypothetical protein